MPVPVKTLSSNQTNSPTLTGQLGRLQSVLNAVLSDGFNPQDITAITVGTNTATVTTQDPHGYNHGDTIIISGANEAVFNDEFAIDDVVTEYVFTFKVITAETEATGTLSCKIAPLGWEKTEGANISAFRSLDQEATGIYLTCSNQTESVPSRVNMYMSLEKPNPFTAELFPPPPYMTTTVNTSVDYTSAPRRWLIVGTSKCFYLYIEYGTIGRLIPYFFGDIKKIWAR
jgi:hypothetical protein